VQGSVDNAKDHDHMYDWVGAVVREVDGFGLEMPLGMGSEGGMDVFVVDIVVGLVETDIVGCEGNGRKD